MRLPAPRSLLARRKARLERPPSPFVVGVSRSGTTLLRMMLDAHPELTIPPETHFVPMLITHCERWIAEGIAADDLRWRALELIVSHPRWEDFGLPKEELWERLETYREPSLGDPARAFFEAYAAREGKPRWGDKSPPYTWKGPRIQRGLPEAHFIHLIRDGRDVALSLGDVSWGPDDVAEAARKWVSEVSRARKRARKLRRGTYMEIRYEDLVTEPERVLRRVSDFVGLPWNDAMLDYHRGARERMRTEFRELKPLGGGTITAEERMRQHVLVWEPPSPSRAGRWKSDMPRADREAFESVAGKLLADLGYETRA